MVPKSTQLELTGVFLVNLGFKNRIIYFVSSLPAVSQSSSEVEQGSLKHVRDKHILKDVF